MNGASGPFPSTHVSLLSRLRDGSDQRAWTEFEHRYRDLVLRFCRRKGLQAADAEDVAQTVFLSLSRALPGFTYDPSRGRFRDYLFRCVRNAIFRWSRCPERALAQLDTHGMTSTVDSDGEVPAHERELWDGEWAAHHYRLALQQLRIAVDSQTVAILERSLEGASAEQLAGEFGLSLDAVYKARRRARQRMQDLVAEQIREEDDVTG